MAIVAILLLAASASGQDLFLASTPQASTIDLVRAKSTKHSGHVAGSTGLEQAEKINAHLERQGLNVRNCAEHSHDQLNDLIRQMWPHMSEELQEVYKGKDLRQRAHQDLEDFESRWKAEAAIADESSNAALRGAKCAEVLMLWVHHVAQSGKDMLKKVIVLPTMDAFRMEHIRGQPAEVAHRVATSYTCVTGHNMQSNHTSDHIWPHWPAEVHWQGKGHGAYPFWAGPGGSGGTADLEAYWSEKQQAERFYHSSCSMTEVGYSKDTDCYHLFVGGQPNPEAYLYTASKDFCCISGPQSSRGFRSGGSAKLAFPPPGGTEKLAPPQSDWMDKMTLTGTESFKGDFYTGQAKHYLMQLADSEAVTYFWYVTTEDGHPVEQGEGGKSATDSSGSGIQIYHDYNTDKFESTTVDPAVFEVPAICKSTTTKCNFP